MRSSGLWNYQRACFARQNSKMDHSVRDQISSRESYRGVVRPKLEDPVCPDHLAKAGPSIITIQ